MAIVTSKGHFLGAHPSKPNPNDLGFPAHLVRLVGPPPPRAFVTGTLGPTKDQGQQGSCTAHGATSEGERLYRRYKTQNPIFSPAFHYYLEREDEGTLNQGDCGAQVVTSLQIAQNGGRGFCPESVMPYNDADFSTAPNDGAIAAALKNPGGSYHSLGNSIANLKACILSDYTAVIGISVYESFEDDAVATSGLIPYPNVEVEQIEGGHEMHCAIGYDDTIVCPGTKMRGAVLGQNSWGAGWGIAPPVATLSKQRGFYWIPYAYLQNPAMTSDVRMQHLGKPW